MTPDTWVLIRGLTRESGHWGAFPEMLGQALPGSHIACVDLPGAGLLHRQRSPMSVSGIAESCRQQVLELGLAPPYSLLGLSLGGMVAAAWSHARPNEVRRCVLANTSMRPYGTLVRRLRPGRWPQLLHLLMQRDPARAEAAVLQLTSNRPADHADVISQWLALRRAHPVARGTALRQLLAAARYRWPGGRARMPVLVLCSAQDRLVHPSCSHQLAAGLQARIAVHPTAGHDLMLDEGPWVAEQLARWIQGL